MIFLTPSKKFYIGEQLKEQRTKKVTTVIHFVCYLHFIIFPSDEQLNLSDKTPSRCTTNYFTESIMKL